MQDSDDRSRYCRRFILKLSHQIKAFFPQKGKSMVCCARIVKIIWSYKENRLFNIHNFF